MNLVHTHIVITVFTGRPHLPFRVDTCFGGVSSAECTPFPSTGPPDWFHRCCDVFVMVSESRRQKLYWCCVPKNEVCYSGVPPGGMVCFHPPNSDIVMCQAHRYQVHQSWPIPSSML